MATIAVYTNFGGHVVKENRGGTKRGYVPDPLGSTVALVDDAGAVTDTWEYWPYGEVESHTGSSTTPFTFVGTLGYYRDLVSKLTYVRARFYQALIGQWMTTDPLWPLLSAFMYCNMAPVMNVDPSGAISTLFFILVGLVLLGAACALCAMYFFNKAEQNRGRWGGGDRGDFMVHCVASCHAHRYCPCMSFLFVTCWWTEIFPVRDWSDVFNNATGIGCALGTLSIPIIGWLPQSCEGCCALAWTLRRWLGF